MSGLKKSARKTLRARASTGKLGCVSTVAVPGVAGAVVEVGGWGVPLVLTFVFGYGNADAWPRPVVEVELGQRSVEDLDRVGNRRLSIHAWRRLNPLRRALEHPRLRE